jgi:hypothetical protein
MGATGPQGTSVISYCPDTALPPIGQSIFVVFDSIAWMMTGLPVAAGNRSTGALTGNFTEDNSLKPRL